MDDAAPMEKAVRMTKSFFFGFATGIVTTLAVILFYVIVTSFAEGFGPQVLTDDSVRSRVEGFFGTPLPPVAGKLYYREEGFQDSCCHVGLSLPPAEAWDLIGKFTSKEKKDFKVLEAHTRPYHPDESPLWRLEDMTSPVYFEIKRDETYTFVAYDETSQRLLAYFSSW